MKNQLLSISAASLMMMGLAGCGQLPSGGEQYQSFQESIQDEWYKPCENTVAGSQKKGYLIDSDNFDIKTITYSKADCSEPDLVQEDTLHYTYLLGDQIPTDDNSTVYAIDLYYNATFTYHNAVKIDYDTFLYMAALDSNDTNTTPTFDEEDYYVRLGSEGITPEILE